MIQLFSASHQKSQLIERENEFSEIIKFKSQPGVMLNTCNRTEFYEGDGNVSENIVRHLFRVVSGVESSLVGEIAVQGQVKNAYVEAAAKFKLSKGIHQLFQNALHVGKRVRTESGISKGAMSHSLAAVEIICKSGINLNHALITIIGAHKLNEDIIKFLLSKGAETIFLGNKSYEKALTISKKFGCKAFRLDNLKQFLPFTDILISATSAPHTVVHYSQFPKNKKMLIIDLAFPRDVEEAIGNLVNVSLFNINDMEKQVTQNLESRKIQIKKAEEIIEQEVERFLTKQNYYENLITSHPGYQSR